MPWFPPPVPPEAFRSPMNAAEPIRPRTLNLQAIDVCNSRCIMCNIWKDGRREQMSLDELRRYLRQPFFSEVWHVGVTGGEPTLRKDLMELYRLLPECLPKLAGASFITHGLQTNRAVEVYAQVHHHYRQRKLLFEGMVSLDGVGVVHDRVRGREGAFEAASRTLLALQARGVPAIAACTIVRRNVYALHDLLDWGKANGVYVRFRVAEFIRRLYNDDCAPEIRAFDARELRHLVSFFHVLLTDYETNETIRQTYTSILSLLTGGERLTGCPYRKGVAVNVDSRGALACCAPKGTAFAPPGDAAETARRLEAQRIEVGQRHCASCIHDYHDDWNESTAAEARHAQRRGRELYDGIDDAFAPPEAAAVPLDLARMKRVLLAGWYGTETAGDIAILRGIIAEYQQVNPELSFDVASLFPYYTRSTVADWPAELQRRIRVMDYASEAAWQATFDCGALVMAGGPLMDIGETRKILGLFKRFAELGKPRVIEGCGIGPLNRAEYRWNVCRIARLATRISVRDRASRELLRSYGIRKEIAVRPDPATTFLRGEAVRHHGSDGKVIRCFLRELTSEYPQSLTPAQAEENLAGFLRRLLEWYPEHRVELWAMHHFPVGYDDRLFARRLVRQITDTRLTAIWEPRTPGEVFAAMAGAAFCVCMRFHSSVFAAECGAPFLAIDYTAGGKIQGFLDDIGQERRLTSLPDLAALTREEFTAKVWPPAAAPVAPAGAAGRPLVLHLIQSVTGGGGARAMISLARHSRRLGGPEHRIVSLLPGDRAGLELARQAGVDVLDRPDRKRLHEALAAAEVVLVHWWNVPELAALFRAELPPLRLALWLHVGGYHAPQLLTPALIDFADLAVACSPHTHAHPVFAALPEAIRRERTAMVLAGAEFGRLEGLTPRVHAGFNVGYIGTLDPVKMHPEFVAMSCAVRVSGVRFVVCGGGDIRWLTTAAEKLGRRESFDFRGVVEDIRGVLETLDVYGYPLCAETYAAAELNLQEAMFAGVPVVAFPHGGIARLIRHNETGLLVNSPAEYARAIEFLHRHPAERARLGANAAAFARAHWGAENAAREFNGHFTRLLAQPKRRRQWHEAGATLVAAERPRDLAINPGTRLFLESLADAAEPFLASIGGATLEECLAADERIAALPRLMHFTGVLAYRNAHPRDPFLQFWTGLGLRHAGQPREALGVFVAAQQCGFTAPRLMWHFARAAELAGMPADALGALRLFLPAAPEFPPALAMQRRLGGPAAPVRPAAGAAVSPEAQHCLQQAARLLQARRPEEARRALQQALEWLPGNLTVMEALGELECRLGRLDSARRLHAAIVAAQPGRNSRCLQVIEAALGGRTAALQPA